MPSLLDELRGLKLNIWDHFREQTRRRYDVEESEAVLSDGKQSLHREWRKYAFKVLDSTFRRAVKFSIDAVGEDRIAMGYFPFQTHYVQLFVNKLAQSGNAVNEYKSLFDEHITRVFQLLSELHNIRHREGRSILNMMACYEEYASHLRTIVGIISKVVDSPIFDECMIAAGKADLHDIVRSFIREMDTLTEPFSENLSESSLSQVLSFLQSLIDSRTGNHELLRRILYNWVRKRTILPASLRISGVTRSAGDNAKPGGMADVYRGEYSGSVVALKVLRFFERSDVVKMKDLCSEVIVWRQLSHPNVLPFIGLCYDQFDGRVAMVSPWMEGGSLKQYLKENLDVDGRIIGAQIAAGLHYLHSQAPQIIHGDLRADNVLVDSKGLSKVSDFGLSRVNFIRTQAALATGKGTTRWQAPELLYPHPDDPDEGHITTCSDVFAFGMTLYEIFTDNIPFYTLWNEAAVIQTILARNRPRRPEMRIAERRRFNDEIWDLMEQCWLHCAGDRPSVEVAQAILIKSVDTDQIFDVEGSTPPSNQSKIAEVMLSPHSTSKLRRQKMRIVSRSDLAETGSSVKAVVITKKLLKQALSLGGTTKKITPPRQPRAVFGIPLEESLMFAKINDVPAVVFRCIQFLEAKHAGELEATYRLSGSQLVVKTLKEKFNTDGDVDLCLLDANLDNYAVASLLKCFLRELPEAILTRDLQYQLLSAFASGEAQIDIAGLRDLVPLLPLPNYCLLRVLFAHLAAIARNSNVNKMTVANLGIVFGPTLGMPTNVFQTLLKEYGAIFQDTGLSISKDKIHANHLQDSKSTFPVQASTLQPRAVFGVSLEESLAVSQVYNLPSVIYRCIQFLESKHAEQEEGIYRLSGNFAVIKELKDRFNTDGDVDLLATVEDWGPHAITGLLKTFLRELPQSILTHELHSRFVGVNDYVDAEERIKELQELTSQLPFPNYCLLRALIAHLIPIVQNSNANKMTKRNVGIVFSPTLGIPAGVFSLMMSEYNRVFNQECEAMPEVAVNQASGETVFPVTKEHRPMEKMSDI